MVDPNPPWANWTQNQKQNHRRTLPTWMDPKGLHGDIQLLVLKKRINSQTIHLLSIDRAVGRIDGANPINNGEAYLLKIRSIHQFNQLQQLSELIDGTKIKIAPHPILNTCQRVVSCREVLGLSNEEIQENLADQGVTKVYRFIRKVDGKSVPTNSMVLTISGTVAPDYIYFGFIRIPTRPNYPRPLLCRKCGKFGHSKVRCQQQEKCLNCGESPAHSDCSQDPHCLNCDGTHSAMSRSCPFQLEEQEIVKILVNLGISQGAAVREYRNRPKAAQNISQIQQRLTTSSEHENAKDLRIQELEQRVAQLTTQLQLLLASPELESTTETDNSDHSGTTTITVSSHANSKSSKRSRRRNRKSNDDKIPETNSTPKKQCLEPDCEPGSSYPRKNRPHNQQENGKSVPINLS